MSSTTTSTFRDQRSPQKGPKSAPRRTTRGIAIPSYHSLEPRLAPSAPLARILSAPPKNQPQADVASDNDFPGAGTHSDPYLVDWAAGEHANPYNWSNAHRWGITAVVSMSTLCIAFGSSAYSTAIGGLMHQFGATRELAVSGLSFYVAGESSRARPGFSQSSGGPGRERTLLKPTGGRESSLSCGGTRTPTDPLHTHVPPPPRFTSTPHPSSTQPQTHSPPPSPALADIRLRPRPTPLGAFIRTARPKQGILHFVPPLRGVQPRRRHRTQHDNGARVAFSCRHFRRLTYHKCRRAG